ncbi:hypothetical protein SAMN05446037_1001171 [Anaerovirgula multivorans]|uniref:Uncharacterized protein n=2 Tax=Anaerovirgula multivorans TaxID=312168 RepID=A0A238ZXG0_9FIRM|nr:hypothetical protein SAMN05446037_1001171 [Anaerovirgula multivorans]
MNGISRNVIRDLYNKESKVSYEESKKDMFKKNLEKIKQVLEGTNFKTEEEKSRYENKLNEKIKSGEKLSQSEMSYIQRTNPIMYMRIKRVQMQREMLERKLKQCKSKKEVAEAHNQAISMIHEKDPDKQLLVSAYNNVTKEFKNTREYRSLPLDIKDKKNGKISREKEQQKELFNNFSKLFFKKGL